jgi:hypothetical protein
MRRLPAVRRFASWEQAGSFQFLTDMLLATLFCQRNLLLPFCQPCGAVFIKTADALRAGNALTIIARSNIVGT